MLLRKDSSVALNESIMEDFLTLQIVVTDRRKKIV